MLRCGSAGQVLKLIQKLILINRFDKAPRGIQQGYLATHVMLQFVQHLIARQWRVDVFQRDVSLRSTMTRHFADFVVAAIN
jgi:hypothetical protein